MRFPSPRVLASVGTLVLLTAACGGTGAGEASDPAPQHETASADGMTDDSLDMSSGGSMPSDGHDMTAVGDSIENGGSGHHGDGGHGGTQEVGVGVPVPSGAPTRYDADVADAAQTVTVEVVGGAPVGGHQRVEVDLGSVVALMVTSDVAEEVHVHGYDILRAVSDGHPAHFAFTAEIPGVFEVEFEGSGRLLLQLEIS